MVQILTVGHESNGDQTVLQFHGDINKCLAFYCLPQDIYPDYCQIKGKLISNGNVRTRRPK